jgi:hypothetical protein
VLVSSWSNWAGGFSRNRRFHDLSAKRIEADNYFLHGFNLGFVYLVFRKEFFLFAGVAVNGDFYSHEKGMTWDFLRPSTDSTP